MVHHPSVHHFQRSSPKPLGQSKPNFMWSLQGSVERKFVHGVWVTWPRWPPRQYMVKTLQKSSSPEPKDLVDWYVALGPWAHHCSNDDPRLTLTYFTVKSNLVSRAFIWGKLEWKKLKQQMTRVTKGLCLYKNSDPKGLSAPDLGLYTCIKTWKIMYKIRFQRYFFWNLQQMGNFQMSTNSCLPLHLSYIHVEKHLKMCIKSAFKEICLKLATNGRSDKGFLLTSKVCPRGFSALAIYMYKIIKSVYKIRF